MSGEHDRVAEWDAAYVLGALSPADRRTFEEHLAQCASCRDAVAELGPTAGLLSRVSAERARALDEVADPPAQPAAGLRDAVIAGARRHRSRRARVWMLAAAGALVVGAVAVPVGVALSTPPGSVHALADVAGAPLEAEVRLTDAAWGTRIDLVCRYRGGADDVPEGGWPYALAVVDTDGNATTLSTWRAGPGTTTELSAATDLAVAAIGSVEIRSLDGTQVLLRYDAAGAGAR